MVGYLSANFRRCSVTQSSVNTQDVSSIVVALDLQLVYFLVALTKRLVVVEMEMLLGTEMQRQWSLSSSTSTFC